MEMLRRRAFSPYRHGGYSTHFDGNGDKIEFPQTTVIGTNDFTIEAWVYPEGFGATECIFCTLPSGSSTSIQLNVDTGGALELWYKGVQTTDRVNISNVFTLNTWHHIAVVGDGTANEIKIYKDGTQIGSTISYDYNYSASGVMRVGTNRGNVTYFDGYLRDVRLVHSKVYTANFTAPTEPLTAITNTKLLTCHLPYIVDGSSDANAATISGNVSTEPFGPYDAQEYAAGDHGGSGYFDGSGDYLSTTVSAIGTGDFTFECWANFETLASNEILFSMGAYSPALYYRTASSELAIYHGSAFYTSGFTPKPNVWYHIAMVRESGSVKLYVNGQQEGTTQTYTTNITNTTCYIGHDTTSANYEGWISDARLVIGSAVYTSSFTPPTAPLTAITNTELLLNMQGAKIFDKAQAAPKLTLYANTTASTTAYKYLPTSMYFDGTDDYIALNDQDGSAYGTGDFTIETWVYMTSAPSNYYYVWAQGSSTSGTNNFGVYYQSNVLKVWHNGGAAITGTNALSLNTWHHIALSREGTNLKLFLDGTQEGSTATNSSNITSTSTGLTIARWTEIGDTGAWTGYISDLRITKGLARYTANFTPPSAALDG